MTSYKFRQGATEEEVADAERILSVSLPSDFVQYLKEFGWLSFGPQEVYGLGKDAPVYLDLVRTSHFEWLEAMPKMPVHLIPILNDGFGNHYCLDTSRSNGETCPVVFWQHDREDHVVEDDADTFNLWLEELIESNKEPIE